MKIIFTTIVTLFGVIVFAQNVGNVFNSNGVSTTLHFNKVNSTVSGRVLNYSDIQGIPYMHSDYQKAKIGEYTGFILARYNAYTDEVEVKLDEKVQSLPKEEIYSPIKFLDYNEKLIYIFSNEHKEYYYVLSDGNVKLLRRNVVIFVDEQSAQTSYADAQPAKFQNLKPAYFLYKESKLIPIRKENDLIQFFPNINLKSIIKDNKIKLNTEKDLIKLAQLLS